MSRGLTGYFISRSAGVVGPAGMKLHDTGWNLACAGRLIPTKNIGMPVSRREETSFLIMMMIVTGGEIQVEPQLRDIEERAEETVGNVGGSRRKQKSGIPAAQLGVLMEWVRECGWGVSYALASYRAKNFHWGTLESWIIRQSIEAVVSPILMTGLSVLYVIRP